MRAVKLVGPGTLRVEEVPVPEPGPGEVRVRIGGAGLCHSDLHVLDAGELWPVFGFTIGHEGSGWVDAIGPGVEGFAEGDAVIVMLIWSCGRCRACRHGRDNACEVTGSRAAAPATPGLGPDGSMTDYQIVPARFLEPLRGLDPVTSAPLADAGLTPMHAINSARRHLSPGATAVVIGLGGLGHLGLQILAATSGARLVALDLDDAKLEQASRLGADVVMRSDADAADRILELTDGYGVDAVFDFVGAQPTVDLATGVVAPEGAIRFVGLGGGTFAYSATAFGPLPWGVNVQCSYGGTRAELLEVLALARAGKVGIETTRYPLDQVETAVADLRAGRVAGRAVLVP